ncbi:unnamed protein product, partial [Sphacelaria rigidula]
MAKKFPISSYMGEFRPEWTRRWTEIGGSCHYFTCPRDMVVDEEQFSWYGKYGLPSNFLPLAVPMEDWGAFKLIGLLQMDTIGNIYKMCGEVAVSLNDVRSFAAAGEQILREMLQHQSEKTRRIYNKYVYCIPGTGKSDANKTVSLTLVATNGSRVEVYFLRGLVGLEETMRSRLPGMKAFYKKQRVK